MSTIIFKYDSLIVFSKVTFSAGKVLLRSCKGHIYNIVTAPFPSPLRVYSTATQNN